MRGKKQAFNPYLPSWEYVPDGEPYVYGDRLYVFGSHDEFNGKNFCQNDYVCWSAPVKELWNWECHGVIYRTKQDPDAKNGKFMQAPDVIQGPDGRYYLYYTLSLAPFTSVAVSDNLTGPYEYYGKVKLADGHVLGSKKGEVFHFDPGVFRDEDGHIFMYTGFGANYTGMLGLICSQYEMKGAYVVELEEDMLTAKSNPKYLIPKQGLAEGTGFEGHEFYEASSMRKINGKYYLIYSSVLSHELCYATSDYPDRDFTYGGTIVSIGDVGYQGRTEEQAINYLGNTHGSLVCVEGQWYIFYHRQTNENLFSRQACAEAITINEDGSISQVEVTSCGLNGGPLEGNGVYEARIACNLRSKNGVVTYGMSKTKSTEKHPYFTQTGIDREDNGDQYIANMQNGAIAGYKYFSFSGLKKIEINVSGQGNGVMKVSTELGGNPIGEIPVSLSGQKRWLEGNMMDLQGTKALYFTYCGTGTVHFHKFTFVKE